MRESLKKDQRCCVEQKDRLVRISRPGKPQHCWPRDASKAVPPCQTIGFRCLDIATRNCFQRAVKDFAGISGGIQDQDQLNPGQVAGESRMIAVDRSSGETIWETKLATTRSCYGVPAIYRSESGAAQIIDANTGNGMFGLDAASGKLLWNLKVFDMRCCSTPVIAGDIAIGSSGSGGGGNHMVGVRIPKSPNEAPEQVYRIERVAPYVPTPVLKDNRLYLISDKGIASCLHALTGETVWSGRIGGNFGASPILVGDTLLLISLDGEATLLRAGDEFKKLGEVDLGGPVGATPAYASGRLLLRVDDELRCLGGGEI